MLAASFSHSIGGVWLQLKPVRVGRVPASIPAPDRYVTVARANQPVLRVDVYSYGPDCFAFEEVIAWRDLILIGFGSHVHAISAIDHSVVTIELESYFAHLYPNRDFVLLASGERLFLLQPDRSVGWKSAPLGLDGVVVREVGHDAIRGEGEWDPPGGWKPFTVSVVDGSLTR